MVLEILQTVWFVLIAVLFFGFFFLEGYDYGVLILLPFLGKNDGERKQIIESIGPFWEGNEVWLITAGGALFAVFPGWYATLFSSFYLPLFFMLVAIIFRAVAFEFRSKLSSKKWKASWDMGLFFGSLVPAILWGVAFSNILKGIPLNGDFDYVGGFFNLLTPVTLLAGVTVTLFFVYHGALFLMLKTEGILYNRAEKSAKIMGVITFISTVALFVLGMKIMPSMVKSVTVILVVAILICSVISYLLVLKKHIVKAFIANAVVTLLGVALIFSGLFPNAMISSLSSSNNLTLYQASSNLHALIIITIVTVILLPFILVYQGWCYKNFMYKVTGDKNHY